MVQFLKQSTISLFQLGTIWEVMDNGAQELSEEDASDIAVALLALRENRSLCDTLSSQVKCLDTPNSLAP
jgi:hypothetical protein